MPLRALPLLLLVLVALPLAACDSGSSRTSAQAEVAGTYALAELRFVPTAAGIAEANALPVLVSADSYLELTDGGQALLRYRFVDGTAQFITGSFGATARQVGVEFNQESRLTLERLLLYGSASDLRLLLNREADGSLRFEGQRTANLAAFDGVRYAGLTQVNGTLHARFVRRAAD